MTKPPEERAIKHGIAADRFEKRSTACPDKPTANALHLCAESERYLTRKALKDVKGDGDA